MSSSKGPTTTDNAKLSPLPPPPPYETYRVSNPEAIVRTAGLPRAHPNAIARVRRFLQWCLILDYRPPSSEIDFRFPQAEFDHFLRLYQIRTSKKYPDFLREPKLDEEQMRLVEYYEQHYILPAAALGVPAHIAKSMLCTLLPSMSWASTTRPFVTFAALRGLIELCAKFYFDRKIVINAVVESEDTRAALLGELECIQSSYFHEVIGPYEFVPTKRARRFRDADRERIDRDKAKNPDTGAVKLPRWPHPGRGIPKLDKGLRTLLVDAWLAKRWRQYMKGRESEAVHVMHANTRSLVKNGRIAGSNFLVVSE